jgi:hypothetical protein
MTQDNSPYFAAGTEAGERDMERISSCPPAEPVGMDAELSWSIMYRRGYLAVFDDTAPWHSCGQCRS